MYTYILACSKEKERSVAKLITYETEWQQTEKKQIFFSVLLCIGKIAQWVVGRYKLLLREWNNYCQKEEKETRRKAHQKLDRRDSSDLCPIASNNRNNHR